MTRSRPPGISFVALLFLFEAIVAVGIAALLLLVPDSSVGLNTLVERLQLPTAFSSLLAVPPLLTAALAGLVFRGLWELLDWARMAAIVFTFLLSLAAVASLAFVIVFEVGGQQNLVLGAIALVISAGVFLYLLSTDWGKVQAKPAEKESKAESAFTSNSPPASFGQAAVPPPASDSSEPPYYQPYELVPPPPRKPPMSIDRRAATTVASRRDVVEQQTSVPAAVTPAAIDNPIAWLIIRQGPDLGQQIALYPQSIVTIGRNKGRVDAALTDPAISARHCQIRHEQGRFILVDLDSTNGTQINGSRVQRQSLLNGDEIRIGSTLLLFSTSRF